MLGAQSVVDVDHDCLEVGDEAAAEEHRRLQIAHDEASAVIVDNQGAALAWDGARAVVS